MGLSTREIRHQKTKQAILDAAGKIIMEKGIDSLSIRAIAKQIDYSPAGLYEYFGSKEEIIEHVVQKGHQRFYEFLSRVDDVLPADEYLIELGMAYVDFAVQNPEYFLVIFTSIPAPEAMDYQSDEHTTFALLRGGIERGLEQGHLVLPVGHSVMSLVYAHWAIAHGLAMLRVTQFANMGQDFSAADREAFLAFGRGWARPS